MNNVYLERFYEEEAEPLLNQVLSDLERDFMSNHSAWKKNMVMNFKSYWESIQMVQSKKECSAGVLMFLILRTRLLERDYRYKVVLYDEEWYVHPYEDVGDLDVSFIFCYFNQLWDMLLVKYAHYYNKITEIQIEQIMLRLIEPFHQYVVALLNQSLMDGLDLDAYNAVKKADIFQIQAGELMEPCDVVFIQERNKKTYQKVAWLEKKLDLEYCNGDLSNLEFDRLDCRALDLRYANFSYSIMKNASFWSCIMVGTRFRNADLSGALLAFCNLSNADFRDCNLENAYLEGCICYTGKKDWNQWSPTGFCETSFFNANLMRADFTRAVLHGADFRRAKLDGVKFDGASLLGSIFLKEDIPICKFTDDQIGQIFIVDI